MSDLNLCSALEIEQIIIEHPFREMYLLQQRLQLRLNAEVYNNMQSTIAAQRCIFWLYCIMSEGNELVEWFTPNKDIDLSPENIAKEIQVEAIDILHFAMNIGLELRYSCESIEAIALAIPVMQTPLNKKKCGELISLLVKKCVMFIDCLPWKTWKRYADALSIEDIQPLVFKDYAHIYRLALILCFHTGLNQQDVINFYFAKNKENIVRQDNGY